MNYSSIQCISFALGTGSSQPVYTGYNDDTIDSQERIAFMKKAIETAHKSKDLNSNPLCLKVFMAPEFFFRGGNGCYDLETATKISEELRDAVKSADYKDWLFVFGTTLAYYKNNEKSGIKLDAVNFSFIQKGNGEEKDSFVVLKRYMSTVDFIKESVYPNAILDDTVRYISENKNVLDEKRIANYDGTCFFEMGGIKFGVEICSDNKAHRINRSNVKDPIDVLLIPSSGLRDPKLSKNLLKNGVMFNVDGARGGDSKVVKAARTVFFFNNPKMTEMSKISSLANNDQFYSDAVISISKPLRLPSVKKIPNDLPMQKKEAPNKKSPKMLE